MNESKSPLLSKTLWLNFIVALASLAYPPAAAWIAANPVAVTTAFAVINMLLRLVTKQAIEIG